MSFFKYNKVLQFIKDKQKMNLAFKLADFSQQR